MRILESEASCRELALGLSGHLSDILGGRDWELVKRDSLSRLNPGAATGFPLSRKAVVESYSACGQRIVKNR